MKSLFSRHFDKDKSGRLDHQEFKSCLRALGYDLPMVEEGQVDPEFQAILDLVDPNRYATNLPVFLGSWSWNGDSLMIYHCVYVHMQLY